MPAGKKLTKLDAMLKAATVILGIVAIVLSLLDAMKYRVPSEKARRAGEALTQALQTKLRKEEAREEGLMQTEEDSLKPEREKTLQ